jgi:hypothetical protein
MFFLDRLWLTDSGRDNKKPVSKWYILKQAPKAGFI